MNAKTMLAITMMALAFSMGVASVRAAEPEPYPQPLVGAWLVFREVPTPPWQAPRFHWLESEGIELDLDPQEGFVVPPVHSLGFGFEYRLSERITVGSGYVFEPEERAVIFQFTIRF